MAHNHLFKSIEDSFTNLSLNRPDSAPQSEGSMHTPEHQNRVSTPLTSPQSILTSRFFNGKQPVNNGNSGTLDHEELADQSTNSQTPYSTMSSVTPNPFRTMGSATPYARGGFRNSRTWISPDAKHMQDFIIIRNSMRRLFKHSDVAKWKISDYLSHREAVLAAEKDRLDRQVKAKEEQRKVKMAQTPEQVDYIKLLSEAVIRGLHYDEGNRSLVLGEQTIWCHNWQDGKEEIAPWPSYAEMKWEGDDRAKTNVGRYLPLPREMGAPGITWSQLQVVEQYPIDEVARIPTMEDIYLPVDEIDDDVKYDLITKDLEEAMDALLET